MSQQNQTTLVNPFLTLAPPIVSFVRHVFSELLSIKMEVSTKWDLISTTQTIEDKNGKGITVDTDFYGKSFKKICFWSYFKLGRS